MQYKSIRRSNLKLPSINEIINGETVTMGYESLNSLAPNYLSDLYTNNSSRERVKLRNSDTDLYILLMKTANGQNAFSYSGAKWNYLKSAIKQAHSLSTFKRAIKA